jgi:hypothetical protein
LEEKIRIENKKDGNPQRGYSALGVETTAGLSGLKFGNKAIEELTDFRVNLSFSRAVEP